MRIYRIILSFLLLLGTCVYAGQTVGKTTFMYARAAQNANKISMQYRTVAPHVSIFKSKALMAGPIYRAAAAALNGIPLNYPNPFRLSEGTALGYELTRDMNIEIQVYDMFANRIAKIEIKAGEEGGKGTPYYNKVRITKSTFGGYDLPSGVYIYVITHEGEVLGKGKMAVLP